MRGAHARASILLDADRLVNEDRRDTWGDPLESFDRIAALWRPILGTYVTAEQVALCMIGLKISRFAGSGDRDSLVDIAGYAGCLEQIIDSRAERVAMVHRDLHEQTVPHHDSEHSRFSEDREAPTTHPNYSVV